jgi:hypothetical protein
MTRGAILETQPELASQIQKLRIDLFWTRCMLAALLLCLVAMSVTIWARHPNTVEANQFVVRNRTGNVTARLGQGNLGDTCLTLTAGQDVSVASMCVQDREGAILDLHNLKSESRATLTPGFYMSEPLAHVQPALIVNGVDYATGKK